MSLQLEGLSDEEINHILEKLSYLETYFDQVVAHQPPSTKTPPLLRRPNKPPNCGIGRLTRLPPELTSSVCLMLDVLSLLRLSQVNRYARNIVATTIQCR